jgi:hypothetical protein
MLTAEEMIQVILHARLSLTEPLISALDISGCLEVI